MIDNLPEDIRRRIQAQEEEVGTFVPGTYNPNSNCIGWVYSQLGVGPDVYTPTPSLGELAEKGIVDSRKLPKPTEPQALAVVLPRENPQDSRVIHIAYIDPDDLSFVTQRDLAGSSEARRFKREKFIEFNSVVGQPEIIPLVLVK